MVYEYTYLFIEWMWRKYGKLTEIKKLALRYGINIEKSNQAMVYFLEQNEHKKTENFKGVYYNKQCRNSQLDSGDTVSFR